MTRPGPKPQSTCSVCVHPWLYSINEELIAMELSIPDIAREYGVGVGALYRHRANSHINILTLAPIDVETQEALLDCSSVLEEHTLLFRRCQLIEFMSTEVGNLNMALHAQVAQLKMLEAWFKMASYVKDLLQLEEDKTGRTDGRHVATLEWCVSKPGDGD